MKQTWFRIVAVAGLAAWLWQAPVAAQSAESGATEKSSEATLREEVEALKQRLLQLETLLSAQLQEQKPVQSADSSASVENESERAAAEPTPRSEVPVGVASSGGQPIAITGLVDAYYTHNFNNPADGTNTLYYTNPNSRGFGLNQVKLEIEAKGDDSPVGFRSDIWFGSGARLFRDGLEPGPLEDVLYLQQAFGYYQWDSGHQLDVGLFGTIAGLEVAESHLNWNYTRGILWAWNEPFSHLGARFTAPLSDEFTAKFLLVNGFDNAFDQNSGKSYGLQGSWAPGDRFNTTLTWIHGPENNLTNEGWLRNVSWNFYGALHEKFEIMGNFDYISNMDPFGVAATSWGLGGYARFSPLEKFRIAQRFEYFDDLEARSTGLEHILKEYTLTFEYAPESRFITRLEYRRDWSTVPFFSRGLNEFATNQDTMTLGFMWVFGPE